jgi:hypothetical protein
LPTSRKPRVYYIHQNYRCRDSYIRPEYRTLPLDVASIEAQVDMEQNARGEIDIIDVGDVTAIALGNSKVEAPGFPGATLLGNLQAFVEKRNESDGAATLRRGYASDKSGLPKLKLGRR